MNTNNPHTPSLLLGPTGQPLHPGLGHPLIIPPDDRNRIVEKAKPAKCITAVCPKQGKWGKGVDANAAIKECKQAGAKGTQPVILHAFVGPVEELNKVRVEGKEIIWPVDTVSIIGIGTLVLNVSGQK